MTGTVALLYHEASSPINGAGVGARVEIVIDGYNVIGSRGGLYGDVAAKRDAFIAELARYARLKGHAVTVVFDGFPPGVATAAGRASGIAASPAGLRVLFAEHERADDVIIRLAQRLREQGTIVSSDREVRDACRSSGGVVLGAQVFDQRLADALAGEGNVSGGLRAVPDKDRDGDDGPHDPHDKRGNPRRLSKSDRKTKKRLDRL
ncbi:MAG: NYN domain-containing protein [Nitrospirota bacterium]